MQQAARIAWKNGEKWMYRRVSIGSVEQGKVFEAVVYLERICTGKSMRQIIPDSAGGLRVKEDSFSMGRLKKSHATDMAFQRMKWLIC